MLQRAQITKKMTEWVKDLVNGTKAASSKDELNRIRAEHKQRCEQLRQEVTLDPQLDLFRPPKK